MKKLVIIGGGLAGFTAAREMKRLNPDNEIIIYAKEAYPYYQRPRLWEFIAGEISQEQLYFRPTEWYQEQGIQLILNTSVKELHPDKQELILDNDEKVVFDRLLIATGADSYLPPFMPDDPGVFALRSLEDALKIISYAEKSKDVMIIGGGLLGLETGRALSKRGLRVKIVEFMPYLLPRQLDKEGAAVLHNHLESLGMQIITSASTQSITRMNDRLHVLFTDSREESADMVLLSTGIRSQVELARNAGLKVNRGILVDQYLETSVPNIFAAGDAAEFQDTVYGIIPAAVDQGRIAGANIAKDKSQVYKGTVPFTRLKIVGVEFNALGNSNLSDTDEQEYTILRKSDPPNNLYQRIVIQNGKIIGAILLGDVKNLLALKTLIENGKDVSPFIDKLLDPETDLKVIAQGKIA